MGLGKLLRETVTIHMFCHPYLKYKEFVETGIDQTRLFKFVQRYFTTSGERICQGTRPIKSRLGQKPKILEFQNA